MFHVRITSLDELIILLEFWHSLLKVRLIKIHSGTLVFVMVQYVSNSDKI